MSKKKVFAVVVDDNKDSLSFISDYLELKNCCVKAFSCPKKALDYLTNPSEPVDILFTDFNMPHMTGIELLKKLASLGKNIPAVMVSADGYDRDIKKAALDSGALFVVCKPFMLKEFDEIFEMLSHHQINKEGLL